MRRLASAQKLTPKHWRGTLLVVLPLVRLIPRANIQPIVRKARVAKPKPKLASNRGEIF
jgi:hypothetical protein